MAGDFPRSSSSLPVFFRVSVLGFSFGFRFQAYRFLGYGNRKLLGFGFQGSFEVFSWYHKDTAGVRCFSLGLSAFAELGIKLDLFLGFRIWG